MEYLIAYLSALTDNAPKAELLFSAVVGLAATLFGIGVLFLIAAASSPLRRRMHAVIGDARQTPGESRLTQLAGPLGEVLFPTRQGKRDKQKQTLVQAGYRSESAIGTFAAIKMLSGLLPAAALVIAATYYPHYTVQEVMMAALLAAFTGMLAPSIVLEKQVKKRRRMIMNGFPDAIDLLVACTEAGLGLNAALQRVAADLSVSYPALAAELALVNAGIRAGVDRTDALRGLADRTGLEEIRGLVSLLSQSLRFGTSIADTLRIYAEDYRDKRTQRAEEQAAKIGTKMIFPLVLCIFPSFFIITVGPAILGVLRAFKL